MCDVGIVVPTLGQRSDYLENCLKSIRNGGVQAHIILVSNEAFKPEKLFDLGLIDEFLLEPRPNLVAAINHGIKAMPEKVKFVTWLGDDDELTESSLEKSISRLRMNDNPVLVYGRCVFMDEKGENLWRMPTGKWAKWVLRFGPQLIAQPGSVFSRDAFNKCGQLDEQYKLAFDFDLFIRLSMVGRLAFIHDDLARFRWHPDSMTVSTRSKSVAEASIVRQSHRPRYLRLIMTAWERLLMKITHDAANLVSKRNTGG